MKRLNDKGFSAIEALLVVVVLVAVVLTGYFVWKDQNAKTSTAVVSSTPATPGASTVPAPQITKASDLSKAYTVLGETSVSSSSADSNQLGSQLNGI